MELALVAASLPSDGNWIIALSALAAMEIVLGIDNIVFIAIVPPHSSRRHDAGD